MTHMDALVEDLIESGTPDSYAAAVGTVQEAYCLLRLTMSSEVAVQALADMVLDAPSYELHHQLSEARNANRIC
jgi:hypothetical protein